MPRRREVPKREILPDPVFGNEVLAKFMNHIMVSGKKSLAEKIAYGAIVILAERAEKEGEADGGDGDGQGDPKLIPGLKMLELGLNNVKPKVEVKSRRVGGATYQVPVEVRPERRMALAMRWVVDAAKKRGEKTMVARLAAELWDAAHNRGAAIKVREDKHRMANANLAFAHFRW